MPKKKTYGFRDKEVAEQLKQLVGGGDSLTSGTMGRAADYIVLTPSGGIAARSGTTVSSASCTVYSIVGTTLTSSSVTLPVWNLSRLAVPGSEYIGASYMGGALVAMMPQNFDVRVKPDGTALQKSFDGGSTWTDWATIGACS